MTPAVRIENLSKRYVIRRARSVPYVTLRDVVAEKARRFAAALSGARRSDPDETQQELWALKDVSFEIAAGERLAVIGRNGAGKSTLLKLLSRITDPTKGRIEIAGRVGSLLEAGTGFHPELTGRENIFLNGVILGMTRAEVAGRFDSIVDFAEIETFIDSPVKRYSSGMYVRLAFAVAVHLQPEILIVDEVLGVGDLAFQRKCLEKLDEVGKEGRTVIFVSHNLEAVARLCNKAILLEQGALQMHGDIGAVLDRYRTRLEDPAPGGLHRLKESAPCGARITSVRCVWPNGSDRLERRGLEIRLEADLDPAYRDKALTVGIGIDTPAGTRLLTCVSSWQGKTSRVGGPILRASCLLPFVPFVPGTYLVSAAVMHQQEMLHLIEHCARFELAERGNGLVPARSADHGQIDVPFAFEFDTEEVRARHG